MNKTRRRKKPTVKRNGDPKTIEAAHAEAIAINQGKRKLKELGIYA